MFIIGNFLSAVAIVLNILLGLYMWILIIRVILSWINPAPHHSVIQQIIAFIYQATDPVLRQIRTRLPVVYGGIDFSPILVVLAIIFLQEFLVGSLFSMAAALR